MLFDQNMIIDATRGSIARFVNHSCEPNCRMVKWIVAGKPRMALFAGDRPIMTGEELTYDYNFDPFSAKNVQECRCGADNCRGVLGPRPKDKPKATIGERIKQAVSAGKRKLGELLSGENDGQKNPKKRKIAVPVRNSASTKAVNAAKGLKRGLSNALNSSTNGKKLTIKNESAKSKVVKTYGSKSGKKQTYLSSSRNSSLTLVNRSPGKGKGNVNAKGNGKKNWKGKGKEIKKEAETENAMVVRSVRTRKLTSKAREVTKSMKTIRVISASKKK